MRPFRSLVNQAGGCILQISTHPFRCMFIYESQQIHCKLSDKITQINVQHQWSFVVVYFLMHTELSNINWPAVIQLLWPVIYICEGLYKSHSLNNHALMFHSVPHHMSLNNCKIQIAKVNIKDVNRVSINDISRSYFLKKRNRLIGTEEIMGYQCFSWNYVQAADNASLETSVGSLILHVYHTKIH